MEYPTVSVSIIGDPLGVERAFRSRGIIERRHMAQALRSSLNHLQDTWKDLAPIGSGREANPLYPTWKPRTPGSYRRSIKVINPTFFEGDNLFGEVFSDDTPTANVLESGSGLYRTGPGGRRMIRPTGGRKYMAIPVAGNVGAGAGFVQAGAKFIKKSRGQRPQHIARKARIASAPFTRETYKLHAKLAAEEIKAML